MSNEVGSGTGARASLMFPRLSVYPPRLRVKAVAVISTPAQPSGPPARTIDLEPQKTSAGLGGRRSESLRESSYSTTIVPFIPMAWCGTHTYV
jgi:hypothetical protein